MAKQENIQILFRAINHEGVHAYLLKHGWKTQPSDTTGMRKYLGPIGESGDPVQLWTWENREHKRYVDRLQNAIFTLTVLEGRAALEIANEIYDESKAAIAKEKEAAVRRWPNRWKGALPVGRLRSVL